MQSVPAKDRPKLIAVIIAIVVALAFVIRNLIGLQTHAQPRVEEPAANAAPSATPTASTASEPSMAAADTAADLGTFTAVTAGGFAPRDPFQPLERVEIAIDATRMPAASTPPAPAPVLPPAPPAAALCSSPVPRKPEVAQPVAAPSSVGASITPPPAELGTGARLVGTVRQDLAALAMFRGSEKAVYIRPQEMIARWRVVRIDDGQVSLRRREVRQIVKVGDLLPTAP